MTTNRRTFLAAIPASSLALAMPAKAAPLTTRDRIEALAEELVTLVNSIAPEGFDGTTVTCRFVREGAGTFTLSWGAQATRYDRSDLPTGGNFFAANGTKYLNAHRMTWY